MISPSSSFGVQDQELFLLNLNLQLGQIFICWSHQQLTVLVKPGSVAGAGKTFLMILQGTSQMGAA
jgi:hypothetical protein